MLCTFCTNAPLFLLGTVGLVGVAYNRAYNAARAQQWVAEVFRV
jgi:hypothetical protein